MSMNFKQLANELMQQGWRAYYFEDKAPLTIGDKLHTLAIRNLIQVQVYEDKKVIFVKDAKPIDK